MRIALLLESDGPGGAETVLLTLAQGLQNLGHDIVPVGPEEGEGWLGERFRELGFEPETFRLTRTVDLQCLLGLRKVLRRRGVQVMHSHEFTMATYGAAAARLTGLPHIITMHGGRYYTTARRRKLALRWAMRSSARTVAVSRFTATDLERSLGFPEGSLGVIPNGHRLRSGDGQRVREELGLSEHHLLIVNVGNLYPVKGQDILIRAVANIVRDRPDAPLHVAIAGRGQQEPLLRRLAQEAGIADRVHLLGLRDDVPDLLAAGDIFALPSRSEGLPLALLEAMFAGTPVVASAVGGIPEVVQHGEQALLVRPDSHEELASALLKLAVDPTLRRRLGEAARDLAEQKFSPQAMAKAYEAVYQDALS